MPTVRQITKCIENVAPPAIQEEWDNSGLQTGAYESEVMGVLVALDVTPAVIAEALRRDCNMVVSHHPLIFRGLKALVGANQVQTTVAEAVRNGIAVYSAHTSLDNNALQGVSAVLARSLGAVVTGPLVPAADAGSGSGVIAEMDISACDFVELVKEKLGCKTLRCTDYPMDTQICRIALCGGSGGEFIPAAISAGAQAYVTGDVRYHDFVDYAGQILVVDAGHYETEKQTKEIFRELIASAFPGLRVLTSNEQTNPVKYL